MVFNSDLSLKYKYRVQLYLLFIVKLENVYFSVIADQSQLKQKGFRRKYKIVL